jgi:hypothetical protein
MGVAAAFGSSLATGNLAGAGGVVASVMAANLSARLMTHAPFITWLAKQTRMPPGVFLQQVQALKQSKDPLMAEAGAALEEQAVNQQASGGQ